MAAEQILLKSLENHICRKGIDMTGNEYQKLAARTMDSKLYYGEAIAHSLHGMAGEVGELHSIYQKVYQGHKIDKEHCMKEVGDLLWFIAEYCTTMEWDLEEVMELNIEKLMKRYPNGFEADKSLHRAAGDI